jgi:hypothetical protein
VTMYSPSDALERTPLGALVQDLAASRICGMPLASQIDAILARRLLRDASLTDATISMPELRTLMIFGDKAITPAARLWAAQLTEQLRTNDQFACSARELIALSDDTVLVEAARAVLGGFGVSWEQLVRPNSDVADGTRFDAPALGPVMRDAVRRRCENASPDALLSIRRFAAARDEDWIVPIAYAAHRAVDGRVPKEMADLFEKHQPVARGFITRNVLNRTNVPTDIVEVMRRGDEASDLSRAARIFIDQSNESKGGDLRALVRYLSEWRSSIQRLIQPPPGLAAATSSPIPLRA